jgi:molecular chaperone GrpE
MTMALAAKPEGEEAANFVKGFEMIRSQLENALSNEGVKEIEALNRPFDANTMQALMTEAKEGVEPGIVLEVLQKGYMLKDRLLRPALVKVSE